MTLGFHVSLSFLKCLANSKASSLIKVPIVCLLRTNPLGLTYVLEETYQYTPEQNKIIPFGLVHDKRRPF